MNNLSLAVNPSIKEPSIELFTDPVKRAFEKYKKHLSIAYIKKMTSLDNPNFSFRFVSLNKAFQAIDMLVKIIKENQNLVSF